jgi:hypothetical protein
MGNHRPGRDEQLIAGGFVALLDYLSRVMQGLDEGRWDYARAETDELRRAADRFIDRLSAEPCRGRATWPPLRRLDVDPDRLRAAITDLAGYYAAGRALYPAARTGAAFDVEGAGT